MQVVDEAGREEGADRGGAAADPDVEPAGGVGGEGEHVARGAVGRR